MAWTDQLLSVLLVLTAIDAAWGTRDVELGSPISSEEFAKALADPTLTAPPPEKYAYSIENSGEYQGDIKLTLEQVNQMEKGRSAIKGSIWENGVIPYTISSAFTTSERQVIARAMAEYERKTCLRFVGRTRQTDYIEIISSTGCWSYVGRAGGKQQLSLKKSGCIYFGIVIHEFMHASGFHHEQCRFDRDNFVTINFQNIQNGFEYNFEKGSTSTTTDLGLGYDYKSIMHYGEKAFSKNGRPTITAKKNVEFGQRDGFSQLDVTGLNLLYNCEDSDCVDKNANCQYWADVGMCEKYPPYMTSNCAKACGECGGLTCVDKNENCEDWAAAGECKKNPGWMTPNCAKSCGKCGSACVDKNKSCKDWAAAGECKKNPGWMTPNCAKSCGKCDAVTSSLNKCSTPSKSQCGRKGGTCQAKSSSCSGKTLQNGCNKKAGCVCCLTDDIKCKNLNKKCLNWKKKGRCTNPEYKEDMEKNCPKACNAC